MAFLYLDSDVALVVAGLLRSRGHTATTARDLSLDAASDYEHLLAAARREEILITHNETDFLLLHGAWRHWTEAWHVSEAHSGIVAMPQGHRYGVDWSPLRIAETLDELFRVTLASAIRAEFVRLRAAGWQRATPRGWAPYP